LTATTKEKKSYPKGGEKFEKGRERNIRERREKNSALKCGPRRARQEKPKKKVRGLVTRDLG